MRQGVAHPETASFSNPHAQRRVLDLGSRVVPFLGAAQSPALTENYNGKYGYESL
jgi:hypothetical protein